MTNAQSYLQTAIQAREAGKLTNWENMFVTSIEARGTDKKALNNLTSAQFRTLREIARKYE